MGNRLVVRRLRALTTICMIFFVLGDSAIGDGEDITLESGRVQNSDSLEMIADDELSTDTMRVVDGGTMTTSDMNEVSGDTEKHTKEKLQREKERNRQESTPSMGAFSSSMPPPSSVVSGLDFEPGKDLGLSHEHAVPPSVVQSVIQAADQGKRDSLYFLGLLKLYGISVSPDDEKALELMRKAAELRHVEAMAALGVMLLHGRGGSRDYGAAAAWLGLAAVEGQIDAMWLLGRMHCEGRGVERIDYIEGNKWFNRAAANGSARGQHYLGVAHEYGFAVRKDQRLAARWHSLAASQDLPESHYHLGLMKAHGRGFAQDLSGAAIHFQKGARHHHAPSMMYLGKMFLHGQGFPIDYDMALLWFERAAKEGVSPASSEAARARDELRASLLEARRVNDQLVVGYDYGLVDGQSSR